MRISGGSARGRKVGIRKAFSTKAEGDQLRPTSAKVRKALFDIIGPQVAESRFLDLYAGSGAVGTEALSRGAIRCRFVEEDSRRAAIIAQIVERFGFGDRASVLKLRALTYLERTSDVHDIAFIDPPYASAELEKVLAMLGTSTVLSSGGLAIAEHSTKRMMPEQFPGLLMKKAYRYGDTTLTVYVKKDHAKK